VETRVARLLVAALFVLSVAQLAVLVGTTARLRALEAAFGDVARRALRAETVSPPPPRPERPSAASADETDLARVEEACGLHAAEVAAALCQGEPSTEVLEREREAVAAPTFDPMVTARARSDADAVVSRAASAGRWSVGARDRLRASLAEMPEEEAMSYRARILGMLNRSELDFDDMASPL
jgi:hypothetical protein